MRESLSSHRVLIFGPPGAGKGTQSVRLAKRFSLSHIATGDIFRGIASMSGEVAERVSALLKEGVLIPDPDVIALILQRLDKECVRKGFILDGFPRTIPQVDALRTHIQKIVESEPSFTCVIYLDVGEAIVEERILSRLRMCQEENLPIRSDDNLEVAKRRWRVYQEQTLPIIEYLQKFFTVHRVDGARSVDEVNSELVSLILSSTSRD
jgi:adenylate kinase